MFLLPWGRSGIIFQEESRQTLVRAECRYNMHVLTFVLFLSSLSGGLLPYAALWHLGFAIWAFSFFRTSSTALSDGDFGQYMVKLGEHTANWYLN